MGHLPGNGRGHGGIPGQHAPYPGGGVVGGGAGQVGQLRQGADFAALARKESTDPDSAARGGELDWFSRGQMLPPFESAAFALRSPGEVSDPVKSPLGYHIIELLERRPESKPSFSEVLPLVRQELEASINAHERRRIWEQAETGVQVNDAVVEGLIAKHIKRENR